MTKVALLDEVGYDSTYKVVLTVSFDTPNHVLQENNINYKSRDVFLNGRKLNDITINEKFQRLCSTENMIFLSVRNKRVPSLRK